ncbi:MAG: hypothetical protein M5R38_11155 [Candidatus Methylomirabilis sp.]|nr:hypothetical protein [Candidatus Methylomirabilis sp.]
MQGVSRILSDLSRYASVVLAPRFAQNTWRRINFVHLNRERILVVLMADSGLVQQKVIAIDELDRAAGTGSDLQLSEQCFWAG